MENEIGPFQFFTVESTRLARSIEKCVTNVTEPCILVFLESFMIGKAAITNVQNKVNKIIEY